MHPHCTMPLAAVMRHGALRVSSILQALRLASRPKVVVQYGRETIELGRPVMFALHPPGDPYLINIPIFGFHLAARWYGVLIVGGALAAGWLAARRAERRGYDPEHVWNLLLLGMVLGILGARTWYVI